MIYLAQPADPTIQLQNKGMKMDAWMKIRKVLNEDAFQLDKYLSVRVRLFKNNENMERVK